MQLKKIFIIVLALICIFLCLNIFYYSGNQFFDGDQSLHSDQLSFPSIIAFSRELKPQVNFCDVKKPVNISFYNDIWQKIPRHDIFLFSAYYDKRLHLNKVSFHFVRIIAAIKGSLPPNLYCYLWSKDSVFPSTGRVTSDELWANIWKHSSKQLYKTYLLSCPIPDQLKDKIVGVSISHHGCDSLYNYFNISIDDHTREIKDFAVCVKGLNFQHDISYKLIEWTQLQLLLGADKISFYVFDVHKNTQKVLNYYKDIGKAETIALTLPGDEPNLISERSQYLRDNVWQKRRLELVPFNDCLYRHLYTHKFIVIIDIDESIVPIIHDNWKEVIDYIFEYDPDAIRKYASFSVQNTYFFDTFDNLNKKHVKNIPPEMYMLRHIHRSANFSQPGFAVKSFVSTNSTLAVFNHYALFPLYNNMSRFSLISKSVAQLNHYRETCPKTMMNECKQNFDKFWKKDTVLWRFKIHLINQFNFVRKLLNL